MYSNILVRNVIELIDLEEGESMKIELIRQRFNDTRGYKYKSFSHCCDKIKDNPRIVFSNEVELDANNLDGCLDDECTFPVFAIWNSKTVGSWGDECENDYYYKINYCPFCGEPIEIFVVGEEDMDNYYKALSKQRDELWKKCNRTDSKKKSEELRKQVQELDDQINWLYELAEYKEVKEK